MSPNLAIAMSTEPLEDGAPEERAVYGVLSISARGAHLSEGFDHYNESYRRGPLVSGYPLAEWLAWHWWRLRWEPRRQDTDWMLAHRMTAVGGGYVWPNVTIFSDGCRAALVAKPSSRPDAKPFRYTRELAVTLSASEWEAAVDDFFLHIIARLDADDLKATNLHRLLDDLRAERSDPELSRLRRIEALLGCNPEDLDEALVEQWIAESESLGAGAVDEIAAHTGLQTQKTPARLSRAALTECARRDGFPASLHDGIRISAAEPPSLSMSIPAWRWGAALAQQLRRQEGLDGRRIDDKHLAAMAGVAATNLQDGAGAALQLGFALEDIPGGGRIAFRAKRRCGRRFELARLLADRLFAPEDKLHPATRAYTYRQKAQRAFAAELLIPADTAIAELDGQHEDEDRREDLAERFGVSPRVIETQLVNRKLLPREELDDPNYHPMLPAADWRD